MATFKRLRHIRENLGLEVADIAAKRRLEAA